MSEYDTLERVMFGMRRSDHMKLKRIAERRQQSAAHFMRQAVAAAIRADEIEEECSLARPRQEPWRTA